MYILLLLVVVVYIYSYSFILREQTLLGLESPLTRYFCAVHRLCNWTWWLRFLIACSPLFEKLKKNKWKPTLFHILRNSCLMGLVSSNLKVILIGCIKCGGDKSDTFLFFSFTQKGVFYPRKSSSFADLQNLNHISQRPGLRHAMLSGWLFFQLTFQIGKELGHLIPIFSS